MTADTINTRIFQETVNNVYRLSVVDIAQQQGGWASLAYKVRSVDNREYFLKVYQKDRASTQKLTKHIDNYMPVIDWLNTHSGLKGKIINPLKTVKGEYKYEDAHNIYLLTEYIEGYTIGDNELSTNQVQQLADIISELHSFGSEDIPLDLSLITENFSVDFFDDMQSMLLNAEELKDDIKTVLYPSLNNICEALEQLQISSEQLKKQNPDLVLCHTDIHHWNMLQTDCNLVLIDWEGLKVAPPEADICLLQNQSYFKTFYTLYLKRHPGYSINKDVLLYYITKRKLEDIFEFMEQLQFDNMAEPDRKLCLYYLERECRSL